MKKEIKHYYRLYRQHQMKVANDGGGMLTILPSGKTELSFGSAPYGEHALAAYGQAIAFINFKKRVKQYADY